MHRDRAVKRRSHICAGLITSIGLLVSIVIAATAVSIGIARAAAFQPAGESSGQTLAVMMMLGLILSGIAAVMRRKPRT